jgi:hypothetical protein
MRWLVHDDADWADTVRVRRESCDVELDIDVVSLDSWQDASEREGNEDLGRSVMRLWRGNASEGE